MIRRLLRVLAAAGGALVALSVAVILAGRFVTPPITPLMVLRLAESRLAGRPHVLARRPVALEGVSPALLRAVIAAEDARFFRHRGIDWRAVRAARAWNARHPDRPRGASTITMQCARSAFLWPGRSWLRKGLEVWLALLMELFWPKRRILEVYLQVVEWGDGVYGAAAAAEHWFARPPDRLDAGQAALLAAVLPAPRRWRPDRPTPGVRRRAETIRRRAEAVDLSGLEGQGR